jgi:Lysozyme inhibitor LprI
MGMPMKWILPFAAVGLAAAAAEAPWDWGDAKDEYSSDFADSKALCRRLSDREPPASDRPDAAAAASLRGCDSEALYYGIGMPADPARARQCAFLEAGRADGEGPFSGRTMLMTIYANGRGARRDLDVAIHLSCGIEGAPFESNGRVGHLAELKAQSRPQEDFHFCDDVTSGLAMGYCAAHEARIAGARREAELARLSRGWTAAETQALERLRQAHEAFASAHGGGEVDMSGTARAAMAVNAEESARDLFLALLRDLAAGHAPRYDAGGYRAADAKLNAAYRQLIQETVPIDSPGAVTREGIRDAQRAWLRYRDSFLAFAAVKYPKISRDSLAAWLTDQRIAMLTPEE